MTIGTSYLGANETLDARAPMLVAATSPSARSSVARWIEEAGWRTAASNARVLASLAFITSGPLAVPVVYAAR